MTVENTCEQVSTVYQRKIKRCLQKSCSVDTVKKRLPIIDWLPKYKSEFIIPDIIAGFTVGLTAIAQGIAYALVAGLPAEYGLYGSLTAGLVYIFFGSTANVTIGPTAIISAMTARYVSGYSPDFAILTAFLSGVTIFLMGVFKVGFLMQFISMPVIKGFTTAAAFQIAASQLKSFFGLQGPSGTIFLESAINIYHNYHTAQLWEGVLGSATVIMLVLLKKMGQGCSRDDGFIKKLRWFFSLSRNAVVVVVGMLIAYILKLTLKSEPLTLIGEIGSGLPKLGLPPFGTTSGNETYTFVEMVTKIGPQALAIPFVSVLETVAIAKAFAVGGRVDATQEMIAVGLCNMLGSCGQSMPITGSFARTALNHVSGVKSPLGGLTNVCILVIALTYLTSTFYFIPKASLAGLIITAMFSMIEYTFMMKLWRESKKELLLMIITIIPSATFGLEYGIIVGVTVQALLLLYGLAKPSVEVNVLKYEKGDMMVVVLCENVSYCAAEHVRQKIFKALAVEEDAENIPIVIDGGNLRILDYTAAYNLMLIVKDLSSTHHMLLMNFNLELKKLCMAIDSQYESKFVYAMNPLELQGVFVKDV